VLKYSSTIISLWSLGSLLSLPNYRTSTSELPWSLRLLADQQYFLQIRAVAAPDTPLRNPIGRRISLGICHATRRCSRRMRLMVLSAFIAASAVLTPFPPCGSGFAQRIRSISPRAVSVALACSILSNRHRLLMRPPPPPSPPPFLCKAPHSGAEVDQEGGEGWPSGGREVHHREEAEARRQEEAAARRQEEAEARHREEARHARAA
jgi:hypothetical protein